MHTGEKHVTAQGNRFTITSPSGSTLQGTVLSPKGAQVAVDGQQISVQGTNNPQKEFLVVMTVQTDKAPEIHLQEATPSILKAGAQAFYLDKNGLRLK